MGFSILWNGVIYISICRSEVPDPPSEILAQDVSSRGTTLSWNVPYTGNSLITKYHLQWKSASGGSWSSDVKKMDIPGSNTSISITALQPMTTYHFRLQAENALGRSPFGETITITTEEEVPSEPPMHVEAVALSTHSIRVMWKPPPTSSTHGKIRGYYVGHKVLNSQEHLVYKTIEESEFDSTMECTITNLRRATEYSITVQAFNSKGVGPPSKDTYVKTHENDPPASPVLRLVSSTSSSVVLSWEIPALDNNPVKGFKLFYKAELPEWDEIEVPDPSLTSYNLRSLNCGTKYQFHIVAYNDVGRSDPSDVVSLTTQGGSPIAPEKSVLLNINTTFVILNLQSWKTGGCPISFFVVQYKSKQQREWVLVSSNLDPSHQEFVVTGLTPATWYNLLMSAHNEAGATEAEYVFATLTLAGGTITPPMVAEREEGPTFYRNLSVLVPIICAVVVLLVITLVILIVCLKKNRNPDYTTPPQNQDEKERLLNSPFLYPAGDTKTEFYLAQTFI